MVFYFYKTPVWFISLGQTFFFPKQLHFINSAWGNTNSFGRSIQWWNSKHCITNPDNAGKTSLYCASRQQYNTEFPLRNRLHSYNKSIVKVFVLIPKDFRNCCTIYVDQPFVLISRLCISSKASLCLNSVIRKNLRGAFDHFVKYKFCFFFFFGGEARRGLKYLHNAQDAQLNTVNISDFS